MGSISCASGGGSNQGSGNQSWFGCLGRVHGQSQALEVRALVLSRSYADAVEEIPEARGVGVGESSSVDLAEEVRCQWREGRSCG